MSDQRFDYVIIGAGSAGCVIANRLSADPRIRVCLLEAGPPDSNWWIHIPGGYFRTIFHPVLSWNFETEAEPGLGGRRQIWPRGRVLGGSSSLNAMLYVRGQAEDFEQWRQLGNEGWGWSDVLPLFRQAEDQERGADAFHGTGGPLGVSDNRATHPLCDAFIDAAASTGIPRNDDFNGRSQEGVGYYQLTTRGGRRCSTARGYLAPVRNRPNLAVVTRAIVTRIEIEEARAHAVLYTDPDSTEHRIDAAAEIILCAGAIKSPHLLMLSGIGPADELSAHGITPVHPLDGVGRNLQDHLIVKLTYRVDGISTLNQMFHSPFLRALEGIKFLALGRGALASGPSFAGGFVKSNGALDLPDLQLHFNPLSGDRVGHLHDFAGCTPIVSQLRPESRGRLWLKSANPLEAPAMVANYLDSETDRHTVVAGMKLTHTIMQQPAMQRYRATVFGPVAAPATEAGSDEDWLEAARAVGGTQYHPISTCRMGTDCLAVTDARLRVRGLRGLRVADASIMPTMISGNINATCIMIGEKASKMIEADRR